MVLAVLDCHFLDMVPDWAVLDMVPGLKVVNMVLDSEVVDIATGFVAAVVLDKVQNFAVAVAVDIEFAAAAVADNYHKTVYSFDVAGNTVDSYVDTPADTQVALA